MRDQFLMLPMTIRELIAGEEGQDLVEYALLISLIALAAITGVKTMASAVTSLYNNISTSFP